MDPVPDAARDGHPDEGDPRLASRGQGNRRDAGASSASSAATTSRADGKRSSRVFSRQRETICARGAGTAAREESFLGSSLRVACRVSTADSPLKARLPLSSS